MRVGVLFSGGKDSTYAAWLARKEGHEIECLITLVSENEASFMFHTPAIKLAKKQAMLMNIPIIVRETKGEKELELRDLQRAIEKAKIKYNLQGIVTGALASDYQASRIIEICKQFKLESINPLWHKNQLDLLRDLVKSKFEVIISGVAAFPLDRKWIGRKIDEKFILEVEKLAEKYKLNPAGEGGEFESLVISCPLFKKKLDCKIVDVIGAGNSWRGIFE
jgi:asparagine synthase (glutamine-hydrolysing)